MIAALDQFGEDHNVCLIAGGLNKKMDFLSVKSRKDKIKAIFLAGESRKLLATLWNDDIHCRNGGVRIIKSEWRCNNDI